MRTYLRLLLVVLSLIPSAQRVEGAQEEPGIPPELRRQALANGTYETPTTGRVRLVDGQFQETRALPSTDYKYTVSAKLQQPIGYGRWHNLPVAAVVVAANG